MQRRPGGLRCFLGTAAKSGCPANISKQSRSQRDGVSGQRKWTPQRRRVFLTRLRASGNVTAAAEAARISRSSAYMLRANDSEFRQAWDDAVAGALDDLEAELHRRAKEGTEKPVFYGGKAVGSVTNYSDNLAMFILRARRPHIYGTGKGDAAPDEDRAETAAAVRRRLEEKLAAAESGDNDGNDDDRDRQ